MQNLFKLLVTALMLIAVNASAMQHAILVQNSGWMEPFYVDPASQLKALAAATADVVVAHGDTAVVLAFNQSSGENVSPALVHQGATGAVLQTSLNKISLAHKGGGKVLADTDFKEAVFKTITGPFKSASGILWIFTNNKNSPNNSSETAERNRDFYQLIHSEPAITRSLAFPLSMPVHGKLYNSNGLMLYALAYGPEAGAYLQSLLASGKLGQIFTQQPAQLKPLDREAIRLVPKEVLNAPNTSASLGSDGKTLFLDIDVSHQRPVVQLVASMENMFFPYDIGTANLNAEISGKGWSNPLRLSPQALKGLMPGAASDITVSIPMQVDLPNLWSPTALFDFGRRVIIPAKITVHLDGQKLAVNGAFRERLQKIFPGDPLPDVFVPPQNAKSSVAEIPLIIRVNYPLYPLVVAMCFLLLLAAAVIYFITRSRSAKSYNLVVDGAPRRVSLSAFGSQKIFDAAGRPIAVVRRRGGAPLVELVAQGHSVNVV